MIIFKENAVINLDMVTDFYQGEWNEEHIIKFFFSFLDSCGDQCHTSWHYPDEVTRNRDFHKILAQYQECERICIL